MGALQTIPVWAAAYIGLPYAELGRTREDGVDCWGGFRLVYRERLGIALPDYGDRYAAGDDLAALGRIINRERETWRPVWESARLRQGEGGHDPGDLPPPGIARPFDGVLLPIAGEPCHVGVALGGTKFLHWFKGTGGAVEDWTGLAWSRRIRRGGIYRHEGIQQ